MAIQNMLNGGGGGSEKHVFVFVIVILNVLCCHIKLAFILTVFVFGHCFRTLAVILVLRLLFLFSLFNELLN